MKKELTKELLTNLYLNQNKSSGEIAKETGYGKTWIVKKLREFELTSLKSKEQRSKSKFDKIQQTNLERYGSISPFGNKEIQEKAIETTHGIPILLVESVRELYLRENKSYREVCKILNISKGRFERICKKFDIYKEYRHNLKSILSKEELEELYINQNLNSIQIANLPIAKGYSAGKIMELIHLYDLQKPSEGNHYKQLNISENTRNMLSSKDNLEKFIIEQGEINTVGSLSERLNISASYLRRFLSDYKLWHYITPSTSKYEIEIQELLKSWSVKAYKNKIILSPQEIDLYCPDYKIGIEFNGNHWHSIENKGRNYHQKKSLLALEKGVFIYHIFEYEWLTRREQIVSQLRNLLGLNENKIFARKCEIREVLSKEAREFLNQNHLQGSDKAPIRLGLFYKDELVSIMTFGKPRFNKQYEYELLRFCCKANTSVVGGASKLFKYFVEKYKPSNILSYSNIAHTKGRLYSLLGFKQISISHPNYVWTRGEQALTRYQCQRHKLIKQFPELKDLSETEIMTYLGYEKLEDAGNITWVWSK